MHRGTARFWRCYRALPTEVQERSDKAFALMKDDPRHPSLAFKRIGDFWSVRIDLKHRALAVADGDDLAWVWVGTHDEYARLIRAC